MEKYPVFVYYPAGNKNSLNVLIGALQNHPLWNQLQFFYSLPSLKNSFLPKEIYNAKENREGIESTVNRSDEAS
jgi:hypothetical protein